MKILQKISHRENQLERCWEGCNLNTVAQGTQFLKADQSKPAFVAYCPQTPYAFIPLIQKRTKAVPLSTDNGQ